MTAKQVLKRALKQLETKGWCKGQYQKSDGQSCLVGAIYAATRPEIGSCNGVLAEMAVNLLGFKEIDEAITWNDRERRRFKHVKDRITKALEA